MPSSPGSSRTASPSSGNATATPADVEIDTRSEWEKKLFDIVNGVADEDIDINSLLQQHAKAKARDKELKDIDINKRDLEGYSVLHLAVLHNDKDMVEKLFELFGSGFDTLLDPLLQAIKDNQVELVDKIWEKYEGNTVNKDHMLDCFKQPSFFGCDITPMLMAAMHGHYGLIEFFYDKLESSKLKTLHLPKCNCTKQCAVERTTITTEINRARENNNSTSVTEAEVDLRISIQRRNLARALSNPSYIAFKSGVDKNYDPILEAFELSTTIEACRKQEPAFIDDYQEILDNINEFPVRLLALCRDEKETKTLLGRSVAEKYLDQSKHSIPQKADYPLLQLALVERRKEFVAEPNAQDIIYQDWLGNVVWAPGSATQLESVMKKIALGFLYLYYPFVAVILYFSICFVGKKGSVLTTPRNRFGYSVAAQFYFVMILYAMNFDHKPVDYIGPPSHYLPWLVVIFVLSHLVSFIKHFSVNLRMFMESYWDWFEGIYLILFFLTFASWFWLLKNTGSHGTVLTQKSALVVNRTWLESDHILHLSEIATAFASAMAGLRLLRPLILHRTIGPLQIAIGKMSWDMVIYLFFFLIIVFSFMMGLLHIYRPYADLKEPCYYCSWKASMENLHWTWYTTVDASNADLPEMEAGPNKTLTNHHILTQNTGKALYIIYGFVTISFMMNMVNSLMTSSLNKTWEKVNEEWKFERAKVWLYYINDTVMPAPFNLLPSCLSLMDFILFCQAKRGDKDAKKRGKCTFADCCFAESEKDAKDRENRQEEYPKLIKRLLQRYFRYQQSMAAEDIPVADDVEYVKEKIAELRKFARKP